MIKELATGVAVLALMAWFIWPQSYPPMTAEVAALPMSSSADSPWQKNGYKITPIKSFQISALILSRASYWRDRESQLSPLDLALGWGPMSDPEILKHVSISQSGRFYYVQWGARSPVSSSVIFKNSSNCHIIPANDSVEKQLKSLKKGQVVDLEGYIVRAESSDGWRWSNSTSWENGAGDRACKILWVEKVDLR